MKRFLLMIALLMMIGVARVEAALGEADESWADFPPVLIYHDVKAVVTQEWFDVSVADFCYQLDWLKSHGFKTLTVEEFVTHLQTGEPFPKKSVFITFDDNYGGIYRYAAPELKRRGMSAAFFVITDSIDKTLSRDYYHTTADELRTIAADPLFSLESHTIDHPHLDQIDPKERQREIVRSKRTIERFVGQRVTLFTYPFGDYNSDVIDDVVAADYAAAFIVDVLDDGTADRPARYSIPRINMGAICYDAGRRQFKKFMRHYGSINADNFADRWAKLPH